MATIEVILLSSFHSSCITTTPPREQRSSLSSSPFPSPSKLVIGGHSKIQGSSRATPIPETTTKGFTSASQLLRRAMEELDSNPAYLAPKALDAPTNLGQKIKPPGKTKPSPSPVAENLTPPKKSRASRAKPKPIAETEVLEDSLLLAADTNSVGHKALKKTRMRKGVGDKQTRIKQGKVVKPGAKEKGKSRIEGDANGLLKVVAVDDSGSSKNGKEQARSETEQALGPDAAILRKRNWTPPPVNLGGSTVSSMPAEENIPCFDSAHITTNSVAEAGLHTSFSSYSYVPGVSHVPRSTVSNATGNRVMKRRIIEVIDTVIPPPQPKPLKKPKLAKKKSQTLTATAIKQFLPRDDPVEAPMLQYLTQPATGIGDLTIAESEGPGKKSRAKAPQVRKPLSTKPKIKRSSLLPPEEALEATRDQDILFGTSSQLAREESPTLLRDIQQAVRANQPFQDAADFPCPIFDRKDATPNFSIGSGISKLSKSKALWSAAARDKDNSLLDIEVIDLSKTPQAFNAKITRTENNGLESILSPDYPMHDGKPIRVSVNIEPQQKSASTATDGIFRDIDSPSISLPKSIAEAALRTRPKTKSPVKKKTIDKNIGPTLVEDSFLVIDSTSISEPKSIVEVASRPCPKNVSLAKKMSAIEKIGDNLSMPIFQGYTTAELSKAISGYGLKPVKGRENMIKLMEKCWVGKNGLALQSLPLNANVPNLGISDQANSGNKPAKRKGRSLKTKTTFETVEGLARVSEVTAKPRGRPKKAAPAEPLPRKSKTPSKVKRKAIKPTSDEIEDPNPPPTPVPPRRSTPKSKAPVQPLCTPSLLTDESTMSLNPTAAQMRLLSKITDAITTYPPSHDPKRPTWHEKMLMYDPIVLEDLAAWLNTEGLGKVGVDEEVGSWMVREWCEGRGVCCLWKENLRGGTRSRY